MDNLILAGRFWNEIPLGRDLWRGSISQIACVGDTVGGYIISLKVCNAEVISIDSVFAKDFGFRGHALPFLVIKSRLCYCSSTNLFQKRATFFGIHGMILWLLIGQYTP